MSEDWGEIGPKAESLRRLALAGLPVPEARFLGMDAFREHADRAGVPALLADAIDRPLDPIPVREALTDTALSPLVEAVLKSWFEELGGGPVAVRSSANVEDLGSASFAGQHGTYFVTDAECLADRVLACYASLFSARAVDYREHHGVAHDAAAMGVIVQRLVDAKAAGVAFTADPVTGEALVCVEACLGIGEALVSGKVTPDRFDFEHTSQLELRSSAVGHKTVQVVVGEDGDVHEYVVDAAHADAPAISIDVARGVAKLAVAAQAVIGAAADVEWAFDGEHIWLLQARPITVAHGAVPSTAGSRIVWSNVNTGEILPDVATPMTWSIIHGHAQEIFGGMFDALGVRLDATQLIGLVGGRIYFNTSLVNEAFQHIPGLDVAHVLGGMHDFIDLPEGPSEFEGAATWSRTRALLALPPYILGHTPARARRFAQHLGTYVDDQFAAIALLQDEDAALELVRSLVDRFDDFKDALAYMSVAMVGFSALSTVCKRWLGDDTGALANRLVAGRGDVVSAESGHAMWRLAETANRRDSVRTTLQAPAEWTAVREALEGNPGASEFLGEWDEFMRMHGHHRRGELELANPTWAEKPDYVLDVLRGYIGGAHGDDPLGRYEGRAQAAEKAAEEARARLRGPLKRRIFEWALGWGRASAASRENIKSQAVRWMVTMRQALLVLGGMLAQRGVLDVADDIFYLRYEELPSGVDAEPSWPVRDEIALRRAEHDRLMLLTPPPVVVGDWDECEQDWSRFAAIDTLRGITVSAGVARGPARVFTSVDSHEAVLPGEILVAPFTDPGWTPYFVPAAGIVMDMGGTLSHGSIIAREYGIPAVVNVGPATRIIQTGQLVEVDGDAGVVRVLAQEA